MHRVVRILARVVKLGVEIYACWLGILATHEAGHALHAILSGGRVTHIELPLFGFSRTDVAPNPRPRFVAWGGFVWGCLIPIVALGALRFAPASSTSARPTLLLWESRAQFFAGFCLIANGAYLAGGALGRVGDADDLLRLGTPRWILMAAGVALIAVGLYVWHRSDAGPSRRSAK